MKFVKGSALVLLVGMGTQAYAEEPVLAEGMMSIGIPVFVEERYGYVVTGKKMISSDAAVVVGAGLISNNNRSRHDINFTSGPNTNDSDKYKNKAYYVSGGYRKYIDKDWLDMFWESSGYLSYYESKDTGQSCSSSCSPDKTTVHSRGIGATVRFGGEHFFSKRFSVEGSVGVTFGYESNRRNGQQTISYEQSDKYFSNNVSSNFSSLNLNYYWK